jgi:osomolarity two-component system sensor histidine kinase TcsA
MERIFALTPVPCLVLDSAFRIIQVSESYLALAKFPLEECVGIDIYEFVESKVPVPDAATLRHAIQTALSIKDVYVLDGISVANGTFWRVRTIPIFDKDELLYVILEAQDTTEEHSKMQALNEQLYTSETYRILVSTVKDYAIFMIDPRGHVLTWNVGAAILKQYKPEEILGKHFSVFYGEADRLAKKPDRELELCLREGKVEDEGWRYRQDGSRFWANVLITPIYRANTLIGFSKVTRDLTERKATEARMIAAFEEASKLKSDFLANMSHEIRTPMHGMLCAVALLIDTGLNSDQCELASIIEESGSVLLQVINDILDYSKLSSGSFTINTDIISVPEIASAVVRCYPAVMKPQVRLELTVDSNVPRCAKGDPIRYRQILQNILSNAFKFTESGHIRVSISLVSEDETSLMINTEVIDTGIGVPIDAVSDLFTPFTQFDNSATKRYKGTGLGLSICKCLTELMGGAIGFRPNVDSHGSVFWFTTKLAKLDQRSLTLPVGPRVKAPARDKLTDLACKKPVLLVEDNVINQTVMVKLLKDLGIQSIDMALDGAQAVQLIERTPLAYSLVLMDINMPVLDGVTASTQIRAMDLDLPIVAMTANALKGDAEVYLAKGFDDYIAKPVDRRALLKVLCKWLQ